MKKDNLKHYDIFISYRKRVSQQWPEMLQQLLESNGFQNRVSFDKDNLNGQFDIELIRRIDECKDFLMFILPETFAGIDLNNKEEVNFYRTLTSLPKEEFAKQVRQFAKDNKSVDFVRIELGRALRKAEQGMCHIVPITLQDSDKYSFAELSLPEDLMDVKNFQAVFFSDSRVARFKDILPDLSKQIHSKPKKSKQFSLSVIIGLVAATIIILGFLQFRKHLKDVEEKEKIAYQLKCDSLKIKIAPNKQELIWTENLTLEQLQAINQIFTNMIKVEGGDFLQGADTITPNVDSLTETPQIKQQIKSLMIGKYEVSVEEYCKVLGKPYNETQKDFPITDISYADCVTFTTKLGDMTGLTFRLPTEAEWEFCAKGGINQSSTEFAGRNKPTEVAWFSENSDGKAHKRNDESGGLYCNGLDLFDMSGNVSEWCDTKFQLYSDILSNNPQPIIPDEEAMVIRGGNYLSKEYEITVTHREPMNKNAKSSVVGMRLVLEL